MTRRIYQAATDEDRARVRELFREFHEWLFPRIAEEFGFHVDPEDVLAADMAHLEIFDPPHGRLLLASDGPRVAGVGCLRQIESGTGEIKRLYVRPEFRGKGIGRALLEELITQARVTGYRRVRLDTAPFMKAAHALYLALGFRAIAPYPQSAIPVALQKEAIFMEKVL